MKTKFYFLITFVFLAFTVSAQKVNVMLTQSWVTNAWVDNSKTSSTYDANGNLIKLSTDTLDLATSTWGNAIMITYTLNPDNTIKESLTQVWDKTTNTWQELITMFTYTASKKKLTESKQLKIGDLTLNLSKTTNTYNDKDSLITSLNQAINPLTSELMNSSQTNYTYNVDGTVSQYVVQTWNMDQWLNSSRKTNTYNASKQNSITLGEKWENNAWINDSRSSYTYNANGSNIESLEEIYLNNAWVNHSKQMYTYNSSNKIIEVITQEWNTDLTKWDNVARITFDYSTGVVPVVLIGKEFKVYPNPFEDRITIENSTLDEHGIQVFNAMGQLINTLKTNEPVTHLDMGGLKKGVYFMKIITAHQEHTIKLLKSR